MFYTVDIFFRETHELLVEITIKKLCTKLMKYYYLAW